MNKVSRFIPSYEKEQYEDMFAQAAFTDVLSELNLGDPDKTDIVRVTHSFEESDVIETSKLMSFGDKAQVILKHYETKSKGQTDIVEVVQVWVKNEDNVVFEEYVNGALELKQPAEELYDVYKDYIKTPEVAEEHEEILAEIMYDPFSCIASGSCCYFEGQRYEHCGMTCGYYNNAGGGTPINDIDRCCVVHDREIQGPNPKPICTAHKNFMTCSKGLKGPGDTTIRNGIRLAALGALCGYIG